MIFDNKIKIYISSIREQKKYSEKGYICNVKDTIEIEIKDKMIITNNEKYGVDNPHQNKDIIKKAKQTNLIKYGCRNTFQNKDCKEKSNQTCLEKYGVKYPQQSEIIREKSRETNRKNYDVDYPIQNKEYYEKQQKKQFLVKKFRDTDLYYQASYEFDFLEKYYDRLKITRGPSIKYVYDGKECIYHPDFFIEDLNLIIEIKSSWWYKVHESRCICKEQETKKFHNYLLLIDKDYNFLEDMLK